MGHSESTPKREVHSNTGLPKKDRKISNKQPTLYLQKLGEEKQSPEQIEGKK